MTQAWYDTVRSEVVYTGRMTVRKDQVTMPDGGTSEREYVERVDAVAVVPVFDDGSVVLLRQYRHAHGRYLLEIPAGKLDEDGEHAEEAAQRELREEAEIEAGALALLTTFENSAGWTTERTHLYLGTDVVPSSRPEGFEPSGEEADMEVVRLPLADAVQRTRAGDITDAKTIIGLLLAAERLGI
jgi:8-oxo-dGDP phosphatase